MTSSDLTWMFRVRDNGAQVFRSAVHAFDIKETAPRFMATKSMQSICGMLWVAAGDVCETRLPPEDGTTIANQCMFCRRKVRKAAQLAAQRQPAA